MNEATRHYTTSVTKVRFESLAVDEDMAVLSGRAEDIGMRINTKKMQLLIISLTNACDTAASISPNQGEVIESVNRMKLVGFTFGRDPGAGAHVESIEEQHRKRKWMLYHQRDSGFKGPNLYRLYCCYVRSSIEYCSAV